MKASPLFLIKVSTLPAQRAQSLYTGNTAGIRLPYFRNWVTSRALAKKTGTYVTSSPTAISESLSIKSCTWYDPSLFPVLKIILLESCLEENVSFLESHTMHVSHFLTSLTSLCRLQLWKRQTHVVEQYCQIFLPFCFMSTDGEGIWKYQFYTNTERILYWLEWW